MGNNKWARHTFVWVLLVLASIFIWFTFIGNRQPPDQVNALTLANDVKAGRVDRIVTSTGSNDIEIYYTNAPKEAKPARLPDNVTIYDLLNAYKVDLTAANVKIETKAASQ